MEMTREMFFNWKELKKEEVVQAIVSNPWMWVEILDFIGTVMRHDEAYHHEKKALEEMYHHKMEELKEKYEILDD